MRIVNKNNSIWRTAGISATDIGALLNVDIDEQWNIFSYYGDLIYKRTVNTMRKEIIDQGSEEWLSWRRKGVTASTVGALVGINQWNNTPLSIYNEKVSIVKETAENEHMRRGKKLEPHVRDLYQSIMGCKVEPICVLHDKYDFMRASLDGIREDNQLLIEIKAPAQANHLKMINIAKELDPYIRQRKFASYFNYYRYQSLYMLLITGVKICHFLSYNEDPIFEQDKLAVIELYAEPKVQENLEKRVIQFWNFVETRTLPPAEWAKNCAEPVTALYGIEPEVKSEIAVTELSNKPKRIRTKKIEELELTIDPF